ncbi:GNAT family N-acetyltransferase [Flavobacterium sp. NKUCC04_CG]|uniref:GNAT family N-acetyltransferase n=1 Tax=Flavobacterium sp. NKUCC04_CG TaxID=2842121 RepID=UPI001C5B38A8|nr:GNAT family N-acetyltransferase [Flavobacterium sp. NKUCC04_CG]MBW3519220.1 GNAT family N-acetyltransferase [Flavobacterium sp. NKUCC04_CG]
MILKTERLKLRLWRETDAGALYEYAKDERIGPIAGWPPHRSVAESAEIIRTVFAHEGIFAVTLAEDDKAIGLVGLLLGSDSNFDIAANEGEVSYWIGVPFWGRGLIPEAVCEILRYGFEDLKLQSIWSGCFDNNAQSKKVQEKCGFKYQYTQESQLSFLNNEKRRELVSRITREEWVLKTVVK